MKMTSGPLFVDIIAKYNLTLRFYQSFRDPPDTASKQGEIFPSKISSRETPVLLRLQRRHLFCKFFFPPGMTSVCCCRARQNITLTSLSYTIARRQAAFLFFCCFENLKVTNFSFRLAPLLCFFPGVEGKQKEMVRFSLRPDQVEFRRQRCGDASHLNLLGCLRHLERRRRSWFLGCGKNGGKNLKSFA